MIKKRVSNLTAVILIAVIALAASFTMISCANNDTDKKETTAAKTEESENAEAIAETNEAGETVVYELDKNGETKSVKKSESKKVSTTATQSTTKATEAAKVCYISIDGYCSSKSITLQGGDTAYSILARSGAAVSGSSSYVKGINGLFEFDKGPQSGWMYSVNGYRPNVSCGSYGVGEGDHIRWYYVTKY